MTTTLTTKKPEAPIATNAAIATYFGKLYSFNNSLKLYHWHVTGKGSYSQHMATDQAFDSLFDITDRIVETTLAMKENLNITIPETKLPSDIIVHATDFYLYVESQRQLFPEAFTQSIIDDYQETIQQLLYRLKRLQ